MAVCEKKKADLVFLLDQSGSISSGDYSNMLNFTAELVESFNVNKEDVHVGLAQFSDDPKDEFYLNKYSNSKDVITHIRNMIHRGGNTFIGKALDHIKNYFDPSWGSRAGISKNLVLITDGESHDDVKQAADRLRNLGIEVFAVGIGKIHDLQLSQIAGTPDRLFNVQDFNGLQSIKKKVVDTICDSTVIPPGELKRVFVFHHIPL